MVSRGGADGAYEGDVHHAVELLGVLHVEREARDDGVAREAGHEEPEGERELERGRGAERRLGRLPQAARRLELGQAIEDDDENDE